MSAASDLLYGRQGGRIVTKRGSSTHLDHAPRCELCGQPMVLSPEDSDPIAALHRWAHALGHVALDAAAYAELVAAGRDAAAFLTAANAEVRRLRQALEEIAERSHGVRSFEQSARLAGIHEYATSVLDPAPERVIDGGAR